MGSEMCIRDRCAFYGCVSIAWLVVYIAYIHCISSLLSCSFAFLCYSVLSCSKQPTHTYKTQTDTFHRLTTAISLAVGGLWAACPTRGYAEGSFSPRRSSVNDCSRNADKVASPSHSVQNEGVTSQQDEQRRTTRLCLLSPWISIWRGSSSASM